MPHDQLMHSYQAIYSVNYDVMFHSCCHQQWNFKYVAIQTSEVAYYLIIPVATYRLNYNDIVYSI